MCNFIKEFYSTKHKLVLLIQFPFIIQIEYNLLSKYNTTILVKIVSYLTDFVVYTILIGI